MKKHNRTREKLLERLKQLRLAQEAFGTAWANLPSGSTESEKQYAFNRGFAWAIEKIREIA